MSWDERVEGLAGNGASIYRQEYGGSPAIEGSVVHTLTRTFPDPDHGGSFRELARLEDSIHTELAEAGFQLSVRQINVSVVQPGVAVGLHVHPDQRETWFVVPGFGRLTAYLVDLRHGSSTKGMLNKIPLGYRDTLVGIPEGILHGYWNPSHLPAVLVYLTSHVFTPEIDSPHYQEGRLRLSDLPTEIASRLPPHMEP